MLAAAASLTSPSDRFTDFYAGLQPMIPLTVLYLAVGGPIER